MILPNFKLESKINQTYTILGIDCIEEARDKKHWLTYEKLVEYKFNSRGFRDIEWPEDLDNAVWCFGDSFTVGMGQPYTEIWPQLLQQQTSTRTINISLNGASNDWIARKVIELLEYLTPTAVCIQWSYLHRRESRFSNLSDEARSVHYNSTLSSQDNYENFFKNVDLLPTTANIIHSWIPEYIDFNNENSADIYDGMHDRRLKFIKDTTQLDYARDGHHYDVLTAHKYVDQYITLI